jgi:hypothetical protein
MHGNWEFPVGIRDRFQTNRVVNSKPKPATLTPPDIVNEPFVDDESRRCQRGLHRCNGRGVGFEWASCAAKRPRNLEL